VTDFAESVRISSEVNVPISTSTELITDLKAELASGANTVISSVTNELSPCSGSISHTTTSSNGHTSFLSETERDIESGGPNNDCQLGGEAECDRVDSESESISSHQHERALKRKSPAPGDIQPSSPNEKKTKSELSSLALGDASARFFGATCATGRLGVARAAGEKEKITKIDDRNMRVAAEKKKRADELAARNQKRKEYAIKKREELAVQETNKKQKVVPSQKPVIAAAPRPAGTGVSLPASVTNERKDTAPKPSMSVSAQAVVDSKKNIVTSCATSELKKIGPGSAGAIATAATGTTFAAATKKKPITAPPLAADREKAPLRTKKDVPAAAPPNSPPSLSLHSAVSSLVSLTVAQAEAKAGVKPRLPQKMLERDADDMCPPESRPLTASNTNIKRARAMKTVYQDDPNSFRNHQNHDENNYEMSDHDSGSDWSDSDGHDKRVPTWVQEPNLSRALANQHLIDPDTVFPPPQIIACDLGEIFAGFKAKRRFHKRTSSGNWFQDKLRLKEDLSYKKDMGFRGNGIQ
jgi:hypothetical protein